MIGEETASKPKNQRVPILVYHHVYEEEAPELKQATFETGAGVIGEAEFRKQMQHLADNHWTVVPTSQIIHWLKGDASLPQKAVAIHFDNGWLDNATVVMPLLREFGVVATCFPITDGIEASSEGKPLTTVRTKTEGIVTKPFMTWSHLQQLLDADWEIGAHTATHCKMADKHAAEGDDGVLQEIQTSNDLFKKRLGFAPEHFAYPSGSRTERTDELLASHYTSLRLWHFEWPIHWTFTDSNTSLLAVDMQNIDLRVPFDDFKRVFIEAME